MSELVLSGAGWCYLQGLPSLRGLSIERPGVAGQYSRETEEGHPYILLAEGREGTGYKIPVGMEASLVYPERLFAWCHEQPREKALEMLKVLGLERQWNPVVVWRGYRNAAPTFHQALMSDTHYGYRWYDAIMLKTKELPKGWDMYRPEGCNYMHIYADD